MKVLHVLNKLMPSGAEVMLYCSAPYWQEAGIEAEILATAEDFGPFASKLENAGYPIYHIRFRKSPSFYIAFLNLVRQGKYDLVHIHSERVAFICGILTRLAGIQAVRTIHNCFAYRGHAGLIKRLQRRFLSLVRCTQIAIGPSVRDTEKQYFGNPTVVVDNWYDTNRFFPPTFQRRIEARREIGISDDTFVVITIGNCNSVKNHPTLLKALVNLGEEFDFLYLHVGKEQDGYPERQLAENLGIMNRVRFLGYVQDVLPLLHAADVYVMPSLYEGLGIAAIEGLASGTVSVLTDVPGLRDLKCIEGTIWVKPEVESLTESLKRVAGMSLQESMALGRQTHEKVRTLFGIERGVNHYAQIYKRQL